MAFFPDKVTVNRPSNNNEYLQINFSETKLKVSSLKSSEKKKMSEYFYLRTALVFVWGGALW